jgi:hypothetical protein
MNNDSTSTSRLIDIFCFQENMVAADKLVLDFYRENKLL